MLDILLATNFEDPIIGWMQDNIVLIIENFRTFGEMHLGDITSLGCSLGAVCILFAAAIELFPVMMGQRGPDIMNLVRLFVLAAIINGASWGAVCSTLAAPGRGLWTFGKSMYDDQMGPVLTQMSKNLTMYQQIDSIQASQAAKAKLQSETVTDASLNTEVMPDESWWEEIHSSIGNAILKIVGSICFVIQLLLYMICEFLYLCAVLMTLALGEIGVCVLGMFGPISFALSLLPAWRDAWAQWTCKYVALSLYGGLCWIVLAFNAQLFKFCVEVDAQSYEKILATGKTTEMSMFFDYVETWFGTCVLTIVGFVVGIGLTKMVPELASWIIPSSASSSIASSATALGGLVERGARKVFRV